MPTYLAACILTLWSVLLFAGDTTIQHEPVEKLSPKEIEIITLMETLQLMDIVEVADIMEDMNTLFEEDQNENQD
jgi:hypothetical protein